MRGRYSPQPSSSGCKLCPAGYFGKYIYTGTTACCLCPLVPSSMGDGALVRSKSGKGAAMCHDSHGHLITPAPTVYVPPTKAPTLAPTKYVPPSPVPTRAPTSPTPHPTPAFGGFCGVVKISGRHRHQLSYGAMGLYIFSHLRTVDVPSQKGRTVTTPVYMLQDMNTGTTLFLYYKPDGQQHRGEQRVVGRWLVGPVVGEPPFYLAARSHELRPECIDSSDLGSNPPAVCGHSKAPAGLVGGAQAPTTHWLMFDDGSGEGIGGEYGSARGGAGAWHPAARVQLTCPAPTPAPTPPPTFTPTAMPTASPVPPTPVPTIAPTTPEPTPAPTIHPTHAPRPTHAPTTTSGGNGGITEVPVGGAGGNITEAPISGAKAMAGAVEGSEGAKKGTIHHLLTPAPSPPPVQKMSTTDMIAMLRAETQAAAQKAMHKKFHTTLAPSHAPTKATPAPTTVNVAEQARKAEALLEHRVSLPWSVAASLRLVAEDVSSLGEGSKARARLCAALSEAVGVPKTDVIITKTSSLGLDKRPHRPAAPAPTHAPTPVPKAKGALLHPCGSNGAGGSCDLIYGACVGKPAHCICTKGFTFIRPHDLHFNLCKRIGTRRLEEGDSPQDSSLGGSTASAPDSDRDRESYRRSISSGNSTGSGGSSVSSMRGDNSSSDKEGAAGIDVQRRRVLEGAREVEGAAGASAAGLPSFQTDSCSYYMASDRCFDEIHETGQGMARCKRCALPLMAPAGDCTPSKVYQACMYELHRPVTSNPTPVPRSSVPPPLKAESKFWGSPCVLSGWGEWGACDRKCGSGKQWRRKYVVQKATGHYAAVAPCPQSTSPRIRTERVCNTLECAGADATKDAAGDSNALDSLAPLAPLVPTQQPTHSPTHAPTRLHISPAAPIARGPKPTPAPPTALPTKAPTPAPVPSGVKAEFEVLVKLKATANSIRALMLQPSFSMFVAEMLVKQDLGGTLANHQGQLSETLALSIPIVGKNMMTMKGTAGGGRGESHSRLGISHIEKDLSAGAQELADEFKRKADLLERFGFVDNTAREASASALTVPASASAATAPSKKSNAFVDVSLGAVGTGAVLIVALALVVQLFRGAAFVLGMQLAQDGENGDVKIDHESTPLVGDAGWGAVTPLDGDGIDSWEENKVGGDDVQDADIDV